MGNTYALKIKNIHEKNILSEIAFSNNKRILPFVHFITKINKYYVENLRTGTIIREFTIFNIFTQKENNIAIERVESGYFFEGLDYSLELIPKIEKVLFLCNVVDNSPAKEKGLKERTFILLGNENSYFNSFSNVEKEIINRNAVFIFYDFVNDNVVKIDFEKFRNDHNQLVMGFECQEVFISEICNINNIIQNELNPKLSINENKELINTQDLITEKKEDVNDKESLIKFENNEMINDEETEKENIYLQNIENSVYRYIVNKNDSLTNSEINEHTSKLATYETYEVEINKENLIIVESPVEYDVSTTMENSNKCNNIENEHTDITNNEIYLLEKAANLAKDKFEQINYEQRQNENQNIKQINTCDTEINIRNIKDHSNISTSSCVDSENKNKNFKYTFTKGKNKYNKYLSIYEKIDSNFNYMYNNKIVCLEKDPSAENGVEIVTQIEVNFPLRQTTILNKNNGIILIKGYHLTSSLSITGLEGNTINV